MANERDSDGAGVPDCCADISAGWNRRRFIVATGAAVLAASGVSVPGGLAQQSARLPRLAWVCPTFPVESLTETGPALFAAFNAELRQLGHVEGETIAVDRWSGVDYADRTALVQAAVASAPDVIFACGWDPIAPMLIANAKTIPIVFAGNDPLANGFVTNLGRPGGNITGIALEPGIEWTGKLLQLLAEAVPSAERVAYLAPRVQWELLRAMLQATAVQLNLEIMPVLVEPPYDVPSYERAFAFLAAQSLDAIVIGWSPENGTRTQLLAELALAARLPAIQSWHEFVDYGGLMSYTPDRSLLFRRAARYVVRVLNGENPGDLPVQQPESFELRINLKTARVLGLTLPESILSFATEIIE